jgi:hypothetical protein
MRFKRIFGVDWSGAGRDDECNRSLAVAVWSETDMVAKIDYSWRRQRSTRLEFQEWLIEVLRPKNPPALIGLDFGFGYPRGASRILFGSEAWKCVREQMATLMAQHDTARAVALEINRPYGKNGPFRDKDRSNFHFYLSNGVPYLRLVEQFVPQAISQWYMGSGATVALSSITGMALLGRLLRLRHKGECKFRVFPFENIELELHAIVEIYPALYPLPTGYVWQSQHERDAVRAATHLVKLSDHPSGLMLPTVPGIEDATLHQYAREEGWIAGVTPIITSA